jgi:hypothetical protein
MGYLKSTGSKDQDVLLAMAPLGIPLFILGVWWYRQLLEVSTMYLVHSVNHLPGCSELPPPPYGLLLTPIS